MIRLHTLCWIVGMKDELDSFNGLVVEVIGPLAVRDILRPRGSPPALRRGYLCDAPWLRKLHLNQYPEAPFIGVSVAQENLMPFSDPTDTETTQLRLPYKVKT